MTEGWQVGLQAVDSAWTVFSHLANLVGLEGPYGSFPGFLSWGCFLEVLDSVPSWMLFWTQFYFLVSRFQLQGGNRRCILKRRQPWVQHRNLLPHLTVKVQPLEPTWSLLVILGHTTTSPVGTLVLTSLALAFSHSSFLSFGVFLSFISHPIGPLLPCPVSFFPGDFICFAYSPIIYVFSAVLSSTSNAKTLLRTREMYYTISTYKELVV